MAPVRRAALLGITLALGLAACSNGTKSTTTKRAEVAVTLGAATVATPGAPMELTDAQKAAVTQALTEYVTAATAEPLQSGKAGDSLTNVFEPTTLTAATGPDRAALLDEGFPTGQTTIAPISATVNALAGSDNTIAVIATTMTVDATTETAKGPAKVLRTATFAFYPSGDTWKVRSYDVTVTRDVPGAGTTTTGAQR